VAESKNFLTREITIAGRKIPVGVIVLGAGGAVVLFIITRGAGATAPGETGSDVNSQIDALSKQMQAALAGQTAAIQQTQEQILARQTGYETALQALLHSQQQEFARGLESQSSALAAAQAAWETQFAALRAQTESARAALAERAAQAPWSPESIISMPVPPSGGGYVPSAPSAPSAPAWRPAPSLPGLTPPSQYVIAAGDSLSRIASRFGMSLGRLQQLNPEFGPQAGRSWGLIYPGEIVALE